MMKNAKMNEKGKLLAIIAVFAMVFAGAAVVMSSGAETDAAIGDKVIDKAGEITAASFDADNMVVVDGVKVTFDISAIPAADAAATYTVYLANKAAAVLSGTANTNITVVIIDASKTTTETSTTYAAGEAKVTFAGDAATIVGKVTIATTSGATATGLTITNTEATTAPAFVATVKVVGNAIFKTATAPANLTYAVSLYVAKDTATTYYETATSNYNRSASSADAADVLTIMPAATGYTGKITFNYGSNKSMISIDAFIAGANGIVISASNAETCKAPTLTATAGDGNEGSITVTSGFIIAGDTPVNGVENLVAGDIVAGTYTAPQVMVSADTSVVGKLIFATVCGTVTQKSNVVLEDGTLGTSGDDDVLIVEADKTITLQKSKDTPAKVPKAIIAGTVVLQGAIVNKTGETGAADYTIANAKIGPLGYTNIPITAAPVNIADDGLAFQILDTVKQDTDVPDAILGGDIEILAGKTLTVTGDLGLNGHKLIVNGKLIVTGSVYSTAFKEDGVIAGTFAASKNLIVLGATGDVDIDGNFAVNTIVGLSLDGVDVDATVAGVSGLSYSAVKDDDGSLIPTIWGILEANTLSNPLITPTVTICDDEVVIPLPLKVSSGVTLQLKAGAALKAGLIGIIDIEGSLVGTAVAATDENVVPNVLTLCADSVIEIDGLVKDVKIAAFQGKLSKDVADPAATIEFILTPGVKSADDKKSQTYVSGLIIGVLLANKNTEQRVYVEGDVSVATGVELTEGNNTAAKFEAKLIGATPGQIYVAEDDTLKIPATSENVFDFKIGTGVDISVVVEGTIQKDASALNCRFIGGHYSIEAGTPKTETHYYEPLSKALDAISLAKNQTVYAFVEKVDFDITIANGQTLALVDGSEIVISDEADVVIESGAVQNGQPFAEVQGTLVQKNGGRVLEPLVYSSKIENSEGDIIWAGLQATVDNAQPGDIIEIVGGKTDGNLVIREDITVKITGKVEIGGDFTVEDGAVVTVEGGEIQFFGGKTHNLNVEGTLDADEGLISKADEAKDKITANVPGTLALMSGTAADEFDTFNGAGYTIATGYVLTTVGKAIPGAIDAAIDYEVTIFGNAVWVADITVEKVTIVFKTDAVLNFAGIVTLDEATINVANGTFTGTVTANAVLLGSATVEFTAVKGTLKITEDNGLTLSDNLTAGIVSLESGVTIFGDLTMGDALLMVGERATAHVHGATTITNGVFTIAGTVAADDGGRLALEGGVNMVSATGTLVAQKTATAGNIDIKTLTVYGTLKENGGTITLTANVGETTGLIIGDEPSSLGAANGTVIGNITTGAGKVILIYAGAEFGEMKIDGATTYKATVFMINGVEYQFLVSSGAEDITADFLAASDYDLPGYEGTAALKTIGGWEFGTASPKVGAPALVTATLEKSRYDVTISPIKGMSIVVDGVTYKNTTEAELIVGEHTLSFTLDPGYKIKDGSSVTMTFNSVKVTNAIIITPDMAGQDLILAASGEIVIDQEIPEQEKQDDTVIIILLAILVVMVVILAIVTILRMMRS